MTAKLLIGTGWPIRDVTIDHVTPRLQTHNFIGFCEVQNEDGTGGRVPFSNVLIWTLLDVQERVAWYRLTGVEDV